MAPERRYSQGAEELVGDAGARPDRALEVAVADRRRLRSGPVDPADGLGERVAVGGPRTRGEQRAIRSSAELLHRPVPLDVLDGVAAARAEEVDDALLEGRSPGVGAVRRGTPA